VSAPLLTHLASSDTKGKKRKDHVIRSNYHKNAKKEKREGSRRGTIPSSSPLTAKQRTGKKEERERGAYDEYIIGELLKREDSKLFSLRDVGPKKKREKERKDRPSILTRAWTEGKKKEKKKGGWPPFYWP